MSFLNMFRPKKLRYHRVGRISESSDSPTQPLLRHNHSQFMEAAELKHDDVQVLWAKFSMLEKEIVAFKSNLSRLETKFQTKTKEGSNQQEAITSVEQRVDKLEKKLDGISFRHEAQKEMNSNEIAKQGGAIRKIEENNSNLEKKVAELETRKIEEKNSDLEKKVAELETRINEMTSSMVDTAAVISEFQDKYSSKPQEKSFLSVSGI